MRKFVLSSAANNIRNFREVHLRKASGYNCIRRFFILYLIFLTIFSGKAYTETNVRRKVDIAMLNGRRLLTNNLKQEYYLYIPDNFTGEELWPLFIGVHVYLSNGAGAQEMWKKHASTYKFILVCPSFPDGFQWLQHNTAERMINIINEVRSFKVTNDKVFIAGFSGGAQFASRFAIYNPEYVTAVVSMSAGGYDMPTNGGNKVKFFISVGELDLDPPSRVDKAKKFYYFALQKGYDIKLTIYPGIGHQYTTQMEKDTLNFYKTVMIDTK